MTFVCELYLIFARFNMLFFISQENVGCKPKEAKHGNITTSDTDPCFSTEGSKQLPEKSSTEDDKENISNDDLICAIAVRSSSPRAGCNSHKTSGKVLGGQSHFYYQTV